MTGLWRILGTRTRIRLVVCIAAAVLAALAEVALVADVGSLAGALVADRPASLVAARLSITAAGWAVLCAVAVAAGRDCGYGMSAALHDSLAAQLLRLPLGWFGPRRHGQVSHLLGTRVMSVMSIPAHLLIPALRAVVLPAGLIVLIARFDPLAGLVALLWTPVLVMVQRWSARRAAAGDAALAGARAEAADRVIEYVDGQRSLRLLPDAEHAASLVKQSVGELTGRMEEQVDSVLRVLGLFGLSVQLMLITVGGTGLLRAGARSTADVTVFVLAAVVLASTLQAAAGLSATIRASCESAAELRGFLALPALPEPAAPVSPAPRGEIIVEDAWAGEDREHPLLRGVSFTAPPGSVTAVVGSSGAGKTSLLRLLARFFDPYRGRVLLDGADCRLLGSAQVHERIAMVFQDVELFAGSLEENIRLGRPDASDTELKEAMAGAGMGEMIERLPHGMATTVGELGVGVSGGERQRVCVARALLKRAPVLLLDEASSSLDAHHQQLLEQTVAALRGSTTVVLVTHRLALARTADQILVLDQGRIVERGRHDELLAAGGLYARMWAEEAGESPE
ncbi:ABC transporter ATP-binding protein [Propionibacterium australiense]|uniref:AAA+ ATPase domain n=1 Tax=Propionibacterium australiense TaxID=119981 RepID=A0A383S7J5_9ACTN|nr:ABC transporter ATP-binding protein [Propionibacterium australiense]RLP07623.1 ATP-binding cassette domain-containing protein [Propionibacterium australiense]SYZ33980.1 AAA+ ATPase domain [Propionibacterium australiense]VEH88957.1 Iron import ATP-binding/permease protein IrtB [Propionibacterium australiense]